MTVENKTVEELATDLKSQYQKSFDEVKEIASKAVDEAKKQGEINKKTAEKSDEALLKMNELMVKVGEVEQAVANVADKGVDVKKTIGQMLTESDGFKALVGSAARRGSATIELKAILTSLTTDAAGSVGDAIPIDRRPGLLEMPQRKMTVRDLLTPGTTGSNALEYVQETGFTNNAAGVAEGAALPQSDIKFDLKSVTVKLVGHHMKASRQALDDVAQLQSIIDNRLRYGLAYKEEAQLLNGDGTGQNLLGIIPQATAYAAPITLTSPTSIDVMRLAMLQAALAEFPATGHVMNPIDWAWVETLKDSQGRYIIGNPQGTITPTLWGLPVVQTQAIAVDKFLTGAFKLGAQIFDRMSAIVEVATENEDDFIKQLITVRAAERLALAVYRPECFIYGDFGRVTEGG